MAEGVHEWGRIADDGTVHVRTAEGERVIGSWQAGSAAEGIAFYTRRFADLETEVALLETRLGRGADPRQVRAAATKLREGLPEAAVIGDLAGLDARLEALVARATEGIESRRAEREHEKAELLARRGALADEAEQLATSTSWKPAGDRLRTLVDDWKQLRSVDRKAETEQWKRISAARAEFGRRRGAHFAALDEQRKTSQARKEALIAEAEKLLEGPDSRETAAALKRLMTEWKAAGRAAKPVDDALWQRFRAVQDTYFSRRSAEVAKRDEELEANLAVKRGLLEEAEKLDPAADLEGATRALRELQERWAAAGRVPRAAMSEVEGRLEKVEQRVRAANDARWRAPVVESSPLVVRLRESVEKLEKRLERARTSGDAALESSTRDALTTQREWLAQAESASR